MTDAFEAEFSEDETPKIAKLSAKEDIQVSAPKITSFSAKGWTPRKMEVVSLNATEPIEVCRETLSVARRPLSDEEISMDDKLGRAQDGVDADDLDDFELDTDIQIEWADLSPDQQAFALGSIWANEGEYFIYESLLDFDKIDKIRIKEFLGRVKAECPTIVVAENVELCSN
jgi:hypothetical protein